LLNGLGVVNACARAHLPQSEKKTHSVRTEIGDNVRALSDFPSHNVDRIRSRGAASAAYPPKQTAPLSWNGDELCRFLQNTSASAPARRHSIPGAPALLHYRPATRTRPRLSPDDGAL